MTVTMHTCRGNFKSAWVAEGGYDPVVEAMFSTDVDGFFMEFDSERAGGFEPLRLLPRGKKVVLGLVTTKVGELESRTTLKRRIDEAAQATCRSSSLCLSPQCGFSSTHHGNALSQDDQWRKLERRGRGGARSLGRCAEDSRRDSSVRSVRGTIGLSVPTHASVRAVRTRARGTATRRCRRCAGTCGVRRRCRPPAAGAGRHRTTPPTG